jgi:hypothetical protein
VGVSFNPNVIYGRGSTMFGWTGRSELPPKANDQNMGDILRKTENLWDETLNDPNYLRGKFEGVTDANGKVVVTGLPGRGRSSIEVVHEQWAVKGHLTPPFRSDFAVNLQPGQAATAKIVVVPKPRVTDKLINAPPPPRQSLVGQVFQSVLTSLGL